MKTFVLYRQRIRSALLVEAGAMESSDCILCGNCIDSCRKKVIAYRFGRLGDRNPAAELRGRS